MKQKLLKHSALLWSVGVSIILFTIGYSLTLLNRWAVLVQNAQVTPFGDLGILTSASGCLLVTSIDELLPGQQCAWAALPNSYPAAPYNYPSFWYLTLASVGIGFESTSILGLLLIGLLSLSVGMLIFLTLRGKPSISKGLLTALFALTPPFFLVMERGNTDMFAFFLLTIGVALVISRRLWFGTLVLSSAAVFKLFPLGAGLVFLLPKQRQTLQVYVFGFLTTAGVITYLLDLHLISTRTPQEIGASFGASVLPATFAEYLFGSEIGATVARIVGVLVFVITFTLLFMLHNLQKESNLSRNWTLMVSSLSNDPASKFLFVAGAGSFGLAYLLGANFDYRLIFLFLAVLGMIRIVDTKNPLVLLAIAALGIVFILANTPTGYSTIADVLLALVAPIMLLIVVDLIVPNRLRRKERIQKS